MKVIIQEVITQVDVQYIKSHEIEIADFVVQTDLIPKSLLDAKGDMIAASADNTPARVAAGVNNQVMTADSAQGAGVKWADHDKASHDVLDIDADTVDGKHWDSIKYVSPTMIVGNKDSVLASGERCLVYIPSAMTLREIRIREIGEISGSATLNLYRYDGISDMVEALIVDCSLTSAVYRAITGRSDSLDVDDWLLLIVSGTPTSVKRLAVALRLERT